MKLSQRITLIVGGGNGLGRAVAIACAQQGATVVVADLNLAAAQETLALAAPGAAARFQLGSRDARHGAQYQSVALDPGSHGPVGVANYGLFCLHGLHLLAGRGRTRGWPC